jgi:hypothetical protein
MSQHSRVTSTLLAPHYSFDTKRGILSVKTQFRLNNGTLAPCGQNITEGYSRIADAILGPEASLMLLVAG